MEIRDLQTDQEQMLLFPEVSTCLSEEHRARGSVSQENKADYKMTDQSCALPFANFLQTCAPSGSSGKMCRVSFRQGGGKISKHSSERLMKSGIMSHGECLTLNTSEWTDSLVPFLNVEGVCSLSDILEVGNIQQKYYLSRQACLGILRRAASRGKDLPQMLKEALERQAGILCVEKMTQEDMEWYAETVIQEKEYRRSPGNRQAVIDRLSDIKKERLEWQADLGTTAE